MKGAAPDITAGLVQAVPWRALTLLWVRKVGARLTSEGGNPVDISSSWAAASAAATFPSLVLITCTTRRLGETSSKATWSPDWMLCASANNRHPCKPAV